MILTIPLDGRAPQVILRRMVRSEGLLFLLGLGATAEPGHYTAELNPYGAVSVALPGGKFGLRPGEFEWCAAPYFRGATVDINGVAHAVRDVDLVMLLSNGKRWRWNVGGRSNLTRLPVAMRVALRLSADLISLGGGI